MPFFSKIGFRNLFGNHFFLSHSTYKTFQQLLQNFFWWFNAIFPSCDHILFVFFSFRPNPITAFLDDYAFLIRGLLDLYEASLDPDWLQWAELLQEQQDRKFWDHEKSGYFTSPEGDTSILIRGKEGKQQM